MSKMYTAEVVADSISPEGHRITSVKVVYPHAVHKDMLRHRAHNRNVESFRAQPPEKIIEKLRGDPDYAFMPDVFAKRVKGMGQSEEAIVDQGAAVGMWRRHIQDTTHIAREFLKMDIAKQQVNFLLQDLCPLTEIITATDWSNFFALRCELKEDGTPVARPEVYKTAVAIREAIEASTPQALEYEWIHLPLVTDEELSRLCEWRQSSYTDADYRDTVDHWIGVSAGRCARISYGDFEWWNERPDDSFARSRKLLGSGHMSPFEQQARPFSQNRWFAVNEMQGYIDESISIADIPGLSATELTEMRRQLEYSGNLHGWVPARKMFPNEHDYSLMNHG